MASIGMKAAVAFAAGSPSCALPIELKAVKASAKKTVNRMVFCDESAKLS